MPTYDYICPKCDNDFFDIKGIHEYCRNQKAQCPKCEHICGRDDRDLSKSRHQFIGTAVQSAEFNPGLGCVVKNKQHRAEIAKQKGLVEVGNDFGSGDRQQTEYKKKKDAELDALWKDPSEFAL